MSTLTMGVLRAASATRSVRYYRDGQQPWNAEDWLTALGGEIGEALNVVKKLNRDRERMKGNVASRQTLLHALADELADVVIYLDLALLSRSIDALRPSQFALDRLRPPPRESTASGLGTTVLIAGGQFASALALSIHDNQQDGADDYYRGMAVERAELLLRQIGYLASLFGIDLAEAVARKFNADSEKHGFPERLQA